MCKTLAVSIVVVHVVAVSYRDTERKAVLPRFKQVKIWMESELAIYDRRCAAGVCSVRVEYVLSTSSKVGCTIDLSDGMAPMNQSFAEAKPVMKQHRLNEILLFEHAHVVAGILLTEHSLIRSSCCALAVQD